MTASDRAPAPVSPSEALPAVIRRSAHDTMKTTMKALMLLACVLFMGAMLRLQHETFAERATRFEVRGRRSRPMTELASAGVSGPLLAARAAARR